MKTTFLSPDEKRLYTIAYIDALRAAAQLVAMQGLSLEIIMARDAILSRINQLEKDIH